MAVGLRQSQSGQTLSHLELLRRVYAVFGADIGGARHAAVGNLLKSAYLRLHEKRIGRVARTAVHVRRDLRIVERHGIGLVTPILAPLTDHAGHHIVVMVDIAQIGLALIPQETARREIAYRSDHGAIEFARANAAHVDLLFVTLRRDAIFERIERHPRLDARAAPVGRYNSHGNALGAGQRVSEEIRHGRHVGHAPRRGAKPLSALAILALLVVRTGALHGEHTDVVRLLGSRQNVVQRLLDGLGGESLHGHLHIALARAHPHLAYEDIVEREALAVADGYASGFERRFGSGHLHGPTPLGIAAGKNLGVAPRRLDGHFPVRLGLAPQVDLALLLQHHVAAQHFRQNDRCRCASEEAHGNDRR